MAKIAYGNKENIQDAIDGNVIPYDALVLTSDGNDAEMFFYDKDGNLKNIVNKTKFTSLDEAQEWILKYPCVGQNFTIYNGTGWGSYIVTSENILNPIATNTDIKNLTENKADKATTYTATETDDMLSTKADKADLDWKLIGEEEVTEADITAAGENGVTAVTIDLGAPIEQWYKETRIDIIIPASTDINSVNDGLFVCMGATEALSLNSDSGCVLMRSQVNTYAVLQYQYLNQIIFHTVWDKALPLYSLYVNSPYNGYAYAYNVYGATTFKQKTKTAIGCQFISVSTKSNVGIFKFPAGTKISIYGRM